MVDQVTAPAGEGSGSLYYDNERQFLIVEGVIARGIPTFPLAPRPKRRSRAATFDSLGGNTTLGIHMSEVPPGKAKPGHRHLDEATFYIVSGKGWTEARQFDDAPMERIDWQAGDVVTIPSNAWHQHFNASEEEPILHIAFKNTRLLRRLFNSRDFVYKNDFRFEDRYHDEPDYWTSRTDEGRRSVAPIFRDVIKESVVPDPDAGTGVGIRELAMGGHLMVDHALVEIAPGGEIRAHRHLAEEAMLVLQGSGQTRLWSDDGREAIVDWTAGDLISPPFQVWRSHRNTGSEPVRFLRFQNNFIELALGVRSRSISLDGAGLPDRFPAIIEADRSKYESKGRDED
jgi:quercetin dioxygenase-like cupin family protein